MRALLADADALFNVKNGIFKEKTKGVDLADY